ncbi:helix-turn-helix domain-containing protein [Chitinophaga ginsengisegetis]|uniref:helix-turn-helix domain-containing protein n=1 Tax=Chitinophaga ginsengisegetis TaxID=393003 RepID=UPI000DBA485A|nr:AraC family transcriptional regulator [Chitinophaga ginsengisegetis]MDR6570364.1 AraC-like DNA-binding protein [Chitinophaga ginsengisegetis]MDR6650098.1 AraC-like DNA-binding protein [Chitinophaga ginsengisegetis]MDR6656261.1 AraC-like DNA-binding protein [Chitinophaga ginsengisegetis]
MSEKKARQEERIIFNNLLEQYLYQGLPVDSIDAKTAFTIHNLKDIHLELPYTSIVYRTNFFSFVFVKDAIGKYTTDEQTFNTSPGTIYFTNPGHFKSFEWKEIRDVHLVTLSESFLKENVHPKIFEEFPFLLAETVPPRTLQPEVFAEFEQLYLQIEKEYFSSSAYRTRMIGNLFVVLLLKIKEYFWEDYNPIYEGNRSSQIVKQFKRTLEQHYRDLVNGKADKVFRVQDYAAAQHLHPNYLSNVIKSKTGKPIGTWISEKTITEARTLLQHSPASIKQIAGQLGFTEATHFSNYFKKQTGISPVLYRKQHTS